MSNLGDSNTPVEGESFGLPAGAELGEDNGELVIKDSGGTIILRRDETNAEWQFENTDLTGINTIDASSATLNGATVTNSPTNNNDVVRKTETDAIQSDVDGKVEQTEFDNHSAQHEDGGTDALDLTGLSGDLADQQQPTDHSHDGTTDSGGASLNPEATTLQDTQEPTTDGEIRRSGSDVFVHTAGSSRNVSEFLTQAQIDKLWVEDANSPNVETASPGAGLTNTLNLSNAYDVWHIFFKVVGAADDVNVIVRINGDSGSNYNQKNNDGGDFTGSTNWLMAKGFNTEQNTIYGSFKVSGRWQNRCGFWSGPSQDLQRATVGVNGDNAAVASPLSSVSVISTGDATEVAVEAYGKDIGQ